METLGVRVTSEVGTRQRPSAVPALPVKEASQNFGYPSFNILCVSGGRRRLNEA